MSVIAIHRDMFSLSPHIYELPEGQTLAAMAAGIKTLPPGWPRHEHDVICVNGQPQPQALWGSIRPKPLTIHGAVTEVTFHAPPMGGGDQDTGKLIATAIASIALIAISGGIATGAILGGLTGAAAAGAATTLSTVLAAVVAVGGNLALSLLAPAPTVPQIDKQRGGPAPGSASAQGNTLEPNGSLPRVVGTRKIFLPYITEPLTYYDGQDEIVEVVGAAAGPHLFTNVTIGGAPVDDMPGVEYEIKEGWPGYAPLSLINRYGRTRGYNTELRGHTTSDADHTRLESQTSDIEDATPQPKILATRDGQDEFWIGVNFPQGLFLQNAINDELRVPLRLRIREKGETTWINLPELHYRLSHVGERRATIKLVWRPDSVNQASVSTFGWVEARIVSPAQTILPARDAWIADAYFDADTGGAEYVESGNIGSNDVQNCVCSQHVAEFNLQESVFPKGVYEVEIVRGYAFKDNNYTASSYQISGSVRDPFWFTGSGTIAQSTNQLSDKFYIIRTNCIWNDPPVRIGDMALLAVKGRNIALDGLSVIASGYVLDWDGSGWNTWTTTSNPAPHMRDLLAGVLNADPVPDAMIDDAGLVTWRAGNWTCDAIIDGSSVTDAGKIIAGCGYAQMYHSDLWGVVRDYDRTGEDPVQTFTPHNTANFNWTRAFAKVPDGYRVTFADSSTDYDPKQIIHPPDAKITEQATLNGLVTEADVRARLEYDIRNIESRTTFYAFDAPADAIVCRRGSLIGLVNSALSAQHGSGRVTDWELDGSGNLTVVHIDQEPPILKATRLAAMTNLAGQVSLATAGKRSGLVIRRSGGVTSIHAIDAASVGNAMQLVTPIAPAGLEEGDMVAVGPLGSEVRRLVVLGMQPKPQNRFEWNITALAEAPEIFA